MSEAPTSKSCVRSERSIPQASLESILCTEELHVRQSRPPNYEKENRALMMLGSALVDSTTTIFEMLAETILDITRCDSAGLSLLTSDGKTPDVCGKRFYWPAIAGMWNLHVGGGTPRNFSPCGDVLDQNRTLLFGHPERRYQYLMPILPRAQECLLVPFYAAGEPVGTIWAIMHSGRGNFDAEDERVMTSLGKFASFAYQAWTHIKDFKVQAQTVKSSTGTLNSWKEIATYLDRGVRTIQRWEHGLGLPVHRIGKGKRSPVFASASELSFWLSTVEVDRSSNAQHLDPACIQVKNNPHIQGLRQSRLKLQNMRHLSQMMAENSVRRLRQTELAKEQMAKLRSHLRRTG